MRFTCPLDCAWELRVASATTGAARARLTGYGRAGAPLVVSLKGRKLGTGQIRFSLTLNHPVNPGVPQTRESTHAQPAVARTAYDDAMSEAKPAYERIEGVQVGQYVSYRFFKVDPAWRRLPVEEREAGKDAFAEVVEEWAGRMEGLRAYNVSGIRPEADFFLWQITERYDDLLELGAALNGTPARRLADDAVLVSRDDEAVGLHRQEARPPGQGDPARGARTSSSTRS